MKKFLAAFTLLLSLTIGTPLVVAQGDTLNVSIELSIKALISHNSVYNGNAYFK